jgi:hypothetical protein
MMKESKDCPVTATRAVQVAMIAWAAILLLITLHSGLRWPWDQPGQLVLGWWRVLPWFTGFVLLQIAAAFVIMGYSAAPEIRFRMCAFSVAVVLAILFSSTATLAWQPPGYGELVGYDTTMYWVGTWYQLRHIFIWCVVPLLAGISFHSTLFTMHALRQLRATRRNVVGACLIAAVLGLGWAGLALAVIVSSRVQHRALQDIAVACAEMRDATDSVTRKFVTDCPGDYRFLLLRAHFLQENGRAEEAGLLYAQLSLTTNTPEPLRTDIQKELAGRARRR